MDQRRGRGRGGRGRRNNNRDRKPKVCRFCETRQEYIDFLNADLLRRFQTENGKILPRKVTGSCRKHQKSVKKAIKRARALSLVL